ncbi:unnamed protein product [Danaus chrysippus]|uniref:(African queen) hypothetical protein n=1 Tax=Danaus chrysippus TaxID=151541 RepID=A0A8J2REM7_9NEOP|nr:unnamed protein product [Danaus chrysippus]
MSLTERVSEAMSEPMTSARTSRGAGGAGGGAWPRTDWTPHANAPLGLRRRRLRAYSEIIVRHKNSGGSFVGNMRMSAKKETRITRNDKNYRPTFLYRIEIQRLTTDEDLLLLAVHRYMFFIAQKLASRILSVSKQNTHKYKVDDTTRSCERARTPPPSTMRRGGREGCGPSKAPSQLPTRPLLLNRIYIECNAPTIRLLDSTHN